MLQHSVQQNLHAHRIPAELGKLLLHTNRTRTRPFSIRRAQFLQGSDFFPQLFHTNVSLLKYQKQLLHNVPLSLDGYKKSDHIPDRQNQVLFVLLHGITFARTADISEKKNASRLLREYFQYNTLNPVEKPLRMNKSYKYHKNSLCRKTAWISRSKFICSSYLCCSQFAKDNPTVNSFSRKAA